jgi:hypothetical protein
MLGFFAIGSAFAVLYIAKVFFKNDALINKAKEKLMWTPVFRG